MPPEPYAKIDGGCNITTSLLGLVKLMALVVWLFSFAFYTGEAEEDEIVMEKRLRQKSCYATVYSPLALPLGELSPQVTERALELTLVGVSSPCKAAGHFLIGCYAHCLPSPSSLRSATSPERRGKGRPHGTPKGVWKCALKPVRQILYKVMKIK